LIKIKIVCMNGAIKQMLAIAWTSTHAANVRKLGLLIVVI